MGGLGNYKHALPQSEELRLEHFDFGLRVAPREFEPRASRRSHCSSL
jgi:hypothetical protein